MSFRLRTKIPYPVIARIADVHITILSRAINFFLAPARYYDSVATYIEVKDEKDMETAIALGAKAFLQTSLNNVKQTYYQPANCPVYLASEIVSGPVNRPKVLVLGKQQDTLAETLFDYSSTTRHSKYYETYGFSRNIADFDHFTPGPNEEDRADINSTRGSYSNDFPSKISMVHNADGSPQCFDIVCYAAENWSNRSCYFRENFDWAEDKLRVGGIMILSGHYYQLKNLLRVIVSRFESVQIFSHNNSIGIYGSGETVTLVGVKKAKRSRDDAFADILFNALTPDKSSHSLKQTVSAIPYHSVYPPESVTIIEEHKLYDDDHLIEMEEVEGMLSPSEHSYGIDTYSVRQKVEGILECKMAIGTSFGYRVVLKGSSIPKMREVCTDLEYKIRFKGEKSHVERTIQEETRDTELATNLSPVIMTKEAEYQYMSQFAHESPLRLHSGLLQKKTEQDELILPVPPKITNLTKLTQHLRGVVQGPDNYWLATKGTVETVETSCFSETDDGLVTFTTTKKRVKQVGILLDGPDKGAIIEVEAA
jgi:hypothetical protein